MTTITRTDDELAPFGWYPDPAGSDLLRWWTGRNWTDDLERPRPEIQPAYGYGADGAVTQRHEY